MEKKTFKIGAGNPLMARQFHPELKLLKIGYTMVNALVLSCTYSRHVSS